MKTTRRTTVAFQFNSKDMGGAVAKQIEVSLRYIRESTCKKILLYIC
jgi:hypothetical protein